MKAWQCRPLDRGAAFQSAIAAINQREASEKLSLSSPQLSIGARIGEKLAAIERGLGPLPARPATEPE